MLQPAPVHLPRSFVSVRVGFGVGGAEVKGETAFDYWRLACLASHADAAAVACALAAQLRLWEGGGGKREW